MFSKLLTILVLITTLASCGGKGGKTTEANIVILGGIASGIPGMTGGTKIYGYNNSTGETINLTYSGQTSLTVPNGVWGFAAITWDGVNPNGSGNILEGDTFCGESPDMELFGGDVAVNITLSNNGCNEGFFGEASTKEASGIPKIFEPFKCISKKSVEDIDETCVASVSESYKVQLPDGAFGGPGLISRCIDADTPANSGMAEANSRLRIPMTSWFNDDIQIKVRLFDGAGCTGTSQDYSINNPYAGLSHPFAAQYNGDGANQGDGSTNEVRLHNDPCLHGEGTGTSPFYTGTEFLICNEVQFEGSSGIEAFISGIYQLQRDLDFIDYPDFPGALVTGIFTGQFHGNGHSISNVTIDASSPGVPVGLFQQINGTAPNTEVENLFLDGITIDSFEGGGIGALVGQTGPFTRIERVDAFDINITTTSSTGPYYSIGGLIGSTSTGGDSEFQVLTMNSVTINIGDAWTHIGGIIGTLEDSNSLRIAKISNLTINDNGSSGDFIGGAVGTAVTSNTEIYGVFINNATIGNATTPIDSGRSMVGGLIGKAYGTKIFNSKVTGTIDSDANKTGGLIGLYAGAASSLVIGNVTDVDIYQTVSSMTGGLIGSVATTGGILAIDSSRSLGRIECLENCGGLIGIVDAAAGTINLTKSFSRSNVTTTSSSITAAVGGLIGRTNESGGAIVISEAFATGVVTGTNVAVDRIGGLTGDNLGADYSDTFFTGTLSSANTGYVESGALIGYMDAGGISESYTTSSTTNADDCIGTMINTPITANVYGVGSAGGCTAYHTAGDILNLSNLTGFGANWANVSNTDESQLISIRSITDVGESYTGTFFDPIVLTTTTQWNAIGAQEHLMNKTYKLGANISFGDSDCGAGFNPIGDSTFPFIGTFRGNNYTISDIDCTEAAGGQDLGLFRRIGFHADYGAGSIEDYDLFDYSISKKLFVDNVSFSTNQGHVGTLAGYVIDSGSSGNGNEHRFGIKITNVEVSAGNIDHTGAFRAGGLIGQMSLTNENSHVIRSHYEGDVSTGGSATGTGGLFGMIDGGPLQVGYTRNLDFAVLSFTGQIISTSNLVGGIVGELNHPQMEMAYSAVDSTGSGINGINHVGGAIGRFLDGHFRNGYTRADVSAANNAGGLVGYMDSNAALDPVISGAISESNVNATTTAAGCITGQNANLPTIYNSIANCSSVTGTNSKYFAFGGFVLGGNQKNIYTGTDQTIATLAINVTAAQHADEDYLSSNTELVYGDPWFTNASGEPALFWEVFPSVFNQ